MQLVHDVQMRRLAEEQPPKLKQLCSYRDRGNADETCPNAEVPSEEEFSEDDNGEDEPWGTNIK